MYGQIEDLNMSVLFWRHKIDRFVCIDWAKAQIFVHIALWSALTSRTCGLSGVQHRGHAGHPKKWPMFIRCDVCL